MQYLKNWQFYTRKKDAGKLRNGLVFVNANGVLFTSVLNATAISKTIDFSYVQIALFDSTYPVHNLYPTPSSNHIDKWWNTSERF